MGLFPDPHERFRHSMRAIQGSFDYFFFCSNHDWLFLDSGEFSQVLSPLSMFPLVTLIGLGFFGLWFPRLADYAEIGLLALVLLALLLDNMFGMATGFAASVQNAGLLSLSRVRSRRVIQISAGFMLFFSILGKFGAVMVVIPLPVEATVYCVLFAYVASVRFGFLQFCNLQKEIICLKPYGRYNHAGFQRRNNNRGSSDLLVAFDVSRLQSVRFSLATCRPLHKHAVRHWEGQKAIRRHVSLTAVQLPAAFP
ncbi:hypothetical protein KIW84_031570 [Lathyrus oleraceus]|uniref:Uncharacterized protein n=1 Tax=Pisum sativum TaxID=3888 RepID=A0A9D4XV92_PEA|nr:hypothetical protein KIW84_031570 [Pisum sativum]